MNTLITAIGSFSASAIGTYPKLIDTIKWAAKTEGLILDPTYTEKAFHALKCMQTTG